MRGKHDLVATVIFPFGDTSSEAQHQLPQKRACRPGNEPLGTWKLLHALQQVSLEAHSEAAYRPRACISQLTEWNCFLRSVPWLTERTTSTERYPSLLCRW